MPVLGALAVIAIFPGRLGEFRRAGKNSPAIAYSSQIFRRIEAGRGELADRAGGLPIPLGANRLGAILDHHEPVTILKLPQSDQVEAVAVEVHRNKKADIC